MLFWARFGNLQTPWMRQRMFQRAVDLRTEEVTEEYKAEADGVDGILGEEEGRDGVRRRPDRFGPVACLIETSTDTLTSPEQGEFRVLMSLSSLRAGMACMLDRAHAG